MSDARAEVDREIVALLEDFARVLEEVRASLERIEHRQEEANGLLQSIDRSQYS